MSISAGKKPRHGARSFLKKAAPKTFELSEYAGHTGTPHPR
jgi:hypothetical protein